MKKVSTQKPAHEEGLSGPAGSPKQSAKSAFGKFAEWRYAVPVSIAISSACVLAPLFADLPQHMRWESKMKARVQTVLSKPAADDEVMSLLGELAFSQKNAQDMLTKLDEIAKAGALRGFHGAAPYGGLSTLMANYEFDSKEFSRPLCLVSIVWFFQGHVHSSRYASADMVADLYASGKLKPLIENAKHER